MLEFFWVSCFFISFTILLTFFGLVNCEWNCIRIILFFQKQPSKDVRICSKFLGEHPCRNVISINLLCNFLEIKLRYGCSPANLLHIFGSAFLKNTTWWLLLFFPYQPLLIFTFLYVGITFLTFCFKSSEIVVNNYWRIFGCHFTNER